MLYEVITIATSPTGLSSVREIAVFYFKMIDAPKHLGRVNDAILHPHVVAVPDSRAALWLERTVFDGDSLAMPERVLGSEITVNGVDVHAMLQRRFTGVEARMLDSECPLGK